jgi:hypothetical protein
MLVFVYSGSSLDGGRVADMRIDRTYQNYSNTIAGQHVTKQKANIKSTDVVDGKDQGMHEWKIRI